MGRFFNGVLVGIGVGILIAPVEGQEMRRLVRQRYEQLRSNLPEKEQVMQTSKQVAANLSQTASMVKDVAQQTATRVQETGGALGDLAQQTAQKVRQTGQGALDATKQATQAVKERTQAGPAPSGEPETVIVFENDMDL